MKCYYDLHIHTALSPCGDDDMTPNNIINMSLLKGLNTIAITDHNSAKNVRSCVECGKKAGLTVIPGMEVETSEEVHVVCLFETVEQAEQMDKIISANLPLIKNRTDIFGNQYVMNNNDEVTDCVENLLSTATMMDIYSVVNSVRNIGGVAIPAHIDKSSYSIISNLGFIPDDIAFTALEVKMPQKLDLLKKDHVLDKHIVIHNSDAHFLWDIHEKEHYLEINNITSFDIIRYFKQGIG